MDIAEIKENAATVAFWIEHLLREYYQQLEIVYIIHDSKAEEVKDAQQFYRAKKSGSTECSSAYQLCLDIVNTRYPPKIWNVYPFHFTDGENFSTDNAKCVTLLKELLNFSRLFGLFQINKGTPYQSYHAGQMWGGSSGTDQTTFQRTLKEGAKDIKHPDGAPKFSSVNISNKDEIWPGIKGVLGKKTTTKTS